MDMWVQPKMLCGYEGLRNRGKSSGGKSKSSRTSLLLLGDRLVFSNLALALLRFLTLLLKRRQLVLLLESSMLRRGSISEIKLRKKRRRNFRSCNRKGHELKRFGKFGKDPTVETSFLPDSEREAEEQAERERLRKQWLREQEQIRNEPLEITYSYWDGAGHRRVIQARKGDTIGEFLRAVQQQLAPEFREIRTTSVENLLYVKEDLIIPHQHSFYELIVNKARGKSGPLFHFDVHEDVRTIADATIEKDESHAGKVVERHWYEKNKHIFPASRWEIYDPTRKWERYTIHGD
ncbi:protein XAP5 CIRCADIAN TIMEKEEPER-like isoform X4 [Telopea speciosissima]|uniref:protein XAP5 CIRCADIAN TIMEKEEPER-like isoform X4 n=1 Tax=Telopea speciosissima TaxID=54955 RepID=UPI001CC46FCA|nr:protein XAP5 CIRCADIAN TIMEKEEPER-like isoform X4 [Telopea speciosissima]XP_043707711.1 protein XAP5 CIRCADIAN TIMEKEEPER-like isoform X4 [Telopea speciosissima]